MKLAKGLVQAYQVQDFAFDALMSLKEQFTDNSTGKVKIDKDGASAIAMVNKVWSDAQERIRIHRGKPLPGSLRPDTNSASKRKRQRAVSIVELVAADAAHDAPSATDAASPSVHSVDAPSRDAASGGAN